jgi:hypothetical protein
VLKKISNVDIREKALLFLAPNVSNNDTMSEKIYDKDSPEYEGYGNYKIDEIDYYTIDSYKNNVLGIESNTSKNDTDSIELGKYVHCDCIKVKPEVGSIPFILAYSIERLEEYFD